MRRKVTTILMAIVLLPALLTSCGKKPVSSAPPGASAQAAPTSAQDLGSVILVLPAAGGKGSETEEVIRYIQQRSGVLIRPVWCDNAASQFTLMIASGVDVDATDVVAPTYYNYLSNDSIMALDGYIEQYGADLVRVINPSLWNWCKKDGRTYAIPKESIDIPYTVQIRKDWLDALSLSMPKTVDDFIGAMKRFQTAYHTAPLLINDDFDMSIDGFFLPMGHSWWKSGDGSYLPPEMHPDYIDLIATLSGWYQEGILHSESFSGNHDKLIEANKIGANIGWYSSTFDACNNLIKRIISAEFVFVQPLAGKYDAGYSKSTSFSGLWVVSAQSKNPRGVVALFNWYVADLENTIIGRLGIPGVHWEYTDKANHLVNMLQDGAKYSFGFELLDVNNMSERRDVSKPNETELKWYYDYWDIDFGDKVTKTYTSLDDRYYISDAMLDDDALSVLSNASSILQEAKVAFITGERDPSQWDEFLSEWRAAGEDKIIASKNDLYRQYNVK